MHNLQFNKIATYVITKYVLFMILQSLINKTKNNPEWRQALFMIMSQTGKVKGKEYTIYTDENHAGYIGMEVKTIQSLLRGNL